MVKIIKFQAPKTKFQTNPNDTNSKFQTNDQSTFVQNGKIDGKASFSKRFGPTAMPVLVIGY
jgi:hypothetical protein